MNMNKNNRNKRDKMDDKAFIRAITRLRRGDQYLQGKERDNVIVILAQNDAAFSIAVVTLKCSVQGRPFSIFHFYDALPAKKTKHVTLF